MYGVHKPSMLYQPRRKMVPFLTSGPVCAQFWSERALSFDAHNFSLRGPICVQLWPYDLKVVAYLCTKDICYSRPWCLASDLHKFKVLNFLR